MTALLTCGLVPRGGWSRYLPLTSKEDEIILRGGNDRIFVNDGDRLDTANAGQGRSDVCYVDARSEAGQGCGRVVVK